MAKLPSLSLYIHIPFCRSRCSYCAFNTYTGQDSLIPTYVDALVQEIEWYGRNSEPFGVHTVYFGGGTPSLLTAEQVNRLLRTIDAAFQVLPQLEVTLEANPSRDTSQRYFRDLRAAGVTRLSLGAQSADQADLRLFNRQHGWEDVTASVRNGHAAGFDNISLDLIYGAPGQNLRRWQNTVKQALTLEPVHMSLYGLSLEDGTPMARWVERGRYPEPDPDVAADMYDCASDMLEAAGLRQYEISNWSREGYECKHNLQYWRREPYLGLGAGGHGFIAPYRYMNVALPREYIVRMQSFPVRNNSPVSQAADESSIEVITEPEARSETMILGLRMLHEGVGRASFREQFGRDVRDFYGKQLDRLVTRDLIIMMSDRVVLTPRARLLANQAFMEFV